MLDAFRTQPVAMMLTASGIAMLLFGGGLLLYERFSSASRRYFLFSSSVSFWLLGSGTGLRAAGDPTPWLRLAYAADALVGPALYWLVLLLTGVRRPLASRTAWAAGLALMLVSLSSDVVADGVRSLSPGTPLGGSALVAVLLFLLLAACVLVSVRELLLAYRRARVPEDRHRHGLMLAAFAVSSLGFLDLVLPWLGLPVLMMSPLAITGGLVVTGIAASRYRLLSGVPLFATREVVRTMSDAVVVVDTDGRIRSANPAAARLSERRPSALRGM
ncbi:MAG TPA: PAS domain-containing protein, partial [Longimicrobiales bacterium]|nr:PAS domain-containing protein [Longimicrobiales bacterium]